MSKNRNNKAIAGSNKHAAASLHGSTPPRKGAAASTGKATRRKRRPILLPVPIIVFLMLWLWASWWQADVFRMIRENSFFAADSVLMKFEMCKPYGILWCIGRMLLTPFRYPWLGGMILSLMLTASCWLLGYAMRLKPAWRWVQYLPIGIFAGIFTYEGLGNWYEAETGQVMGIPFCILLILSIWGIIIHSFSRKPVPAVISMPKDETPLQNRMQMGVAMLALTLPMVYAHYERPYVRPTAQMQVGVMNQDWQRVIDIAHDNDEISTRPMAANYAIALVQTGQIAEHMFDVRLDYDSIYAPGFNGPKSNTTTIYEMECSYHAGLVATAYHHAMESMAMEGPTLRNLKMLCKTSLLQGEWAVAEKYLTILDKVPFEGDFVEKYRAMVGDTARINADSEMAMIRLTEPIHDNFENNFIKPTFLGYNAMLMEGRSMNALINCLMVHIYTKTLEPFMYRAQPLAGSTPPTSIAEALTLMSGKNPQLLQSFSGLEMHRGRLQSFLGNTQQYMNTPEERAKHANELFPQYKGYYPYYYFFGNLKATKKKPQAESSNAGVN